MSVAETILSALESMTADRFCRQMLADSIVCGGAEGVFQRCLMTAVNCLSFPKYFATVERSVLPLKAGESVDMLLYDSDTTTVDRMAHGPEKPKGEFYLRMCRGFVEIKVIWPKHGLSRQYADKKGIRRDVEEKLGKISEFVSASPSRFGEKIREYLIVLLNAAYTFDECGAVPPLDEAETYCWKMLRDVGCTMTVECRHGDRVLLSDERCQSDPRFRVFAKAIVAFAGRDRTAAAEMP
jgi:hypothetical protein